VSRAKIEIVRRFYERWDARDFEALGTLLDPQAVAYAPAGWPEAGPFAGRDVIVRQLAGLNEGLSDTTIALEEISAQGDWVIARHRTRARGDRSGVEGEFQNSVAFRVPADTIVEARFFWDHADALRAAGIEK
jgi:ketosteroid isomerase-like protein